MKYTKYTDKLNILTDKYVNGIPINHIINISTTIQNITSPPARNIPDKNSILYE